METQRFVTIQEWQVKLGLKGNELIAFALIWGFNQAGQKFSGSVSYIAMWIGVSKRHTLDLLKRMVNKGYFLKEERVEKGVKSCSYMIDINFCQMQLDVAKVTGCDERSPGGGDERSPNNIDIYNINNTLSNARAKFSKPSIEEVAAYCAERGNEVDAEAFVSFYESKGWLIGNAPMKDWKAAVRTWEKRLSTQAPPRQGDFSPRARGASEKRETTFERNLREVDAMFGTGLHDQMYGGKTS